MYKWIILEKEREDKRGQEALYVAVGKGREKRERERDRERYCERYRESETASETNQLI